MTRYELRVWPIPHHQVSHPLSVEEFTADSDDAAEARMNELATVLPLDRQVYLHTEAHDRSIAAADGLAGAS